ncbi:hypothetical protein C8Q80DRAFT_159135 [Daedaleopsis nitida]|nr:hypothetical protein C8Q80DRAFT_159135 [Daedaleopsis nitida]
MSTLRCISPFYSGDDIHKNCAGLTDRLGLPRHCSPRQPQPRVRRSRPSCLRALRVSADRNGQTEIVPWAAEPRLKHDARIQNSSSHRTFAGPGSSVSGRPLLSGRASGSRRTESSCKDVLMIANVYETPVSFNWKDLPQGSVLVDVGGGIGVTAIAVANAHPHMRVVVEDLPQVVTITQAVRPLSRVYVRMMARFNTKVRTHDSEMTALSAGWKVKEIRREPGSLWAYAAAVPV